MRCSVYYTTRESTLYIEEKKSKFYTCVFPIQNEEEVNYHLLEIRKKFPKAAHYCFAYCLSDNQEIQKMSDDGEPSRTAGFPILQALLRAEVTNTLIIVIRYFGGIKFGTGGLTRIYGSCATQALETTPKDQTVEGILYTLHVPFPKYKIMCSFIEERSLSVLDTQFNDIIKISVFDPFFYDLETELSKANLHQVTILSLKKTIHLRGQL